MPGAVEGVFAMRLRYIALLLAALLTSGASAKDVFFTKDVLENIDEIISAIDKNKAVKEHCLLYTSNFMGGLVACADVRDLGKRNYTLAISYHFPLAQTCTGVFEVESNGVNRKIKVDEIRCPGFQGHELIKEPRATWPRLRRVLAVIANELREQRVPLGRQIPI